MKVTASDGNGGSVSDTFDIVADLPPDTSPTLVSNAGLGVNRAFSINQDRAQAFTTSAGATLSSVEIISRDNEGDDVAVSLCTVDGSNHPTSRLHSPHGPSKLRRRNPLSSALPPIRRSLPTRPTRCWSRLPAAKAWHWALPAPRTRTPAAPRTGVSPIPLTTRRPRYGRTTPSCWRCTSPSRARWAPPPPTPPRPVATAIPDQTATTGTAFSYAFPATTFTDADSDTLTYTATKSDDTALPLWLSFTAAERAFSGTPQAADVETVSVKVTASDGNSGSVRRHLRHRGRPAAGHHRAAGGLDRAGDPHEFSDQRGQPDLAGDVQRGGLERECGGLRGERNDGHGDGGRSGLRGDGRV